MKSTLWQKIIDTSVNLRARMKLWPSVRIPYDDEHPVLSAIVFTLAVWGVLIAFVSFVS